MHPLTFSWPERILALLAGIFNLLIGTAFFFLPELHLPIWPTSIPSILTRFIGAIVIANGIGALSLAREREWARVRPLALVAAVYGTLVALALLYHLLWLHASPTFWLYFFFDLPFSLVFYGLFIYHDLVPLFIKQQAQESRWEHNASSIR
jgi:O-antigen/teichoic acid export membrane protein